MFGILQLRTEATRAASNLVQAMMSSIRNGPLYLKLAVRRSANSFSVSARAASTPIASASWIQLIAGFSISKRSSAARPGLAPTLAISNSRIAYLRLERTTVVITHTCIYQGWIGCSLSAKRKTIERLKKVYSLIEPVCPSGRPS